jgi:hypothetical protein
MSCIPGIVDHERTVDRGAGLRFDLAKPKRILGWRVSRCHFAGEGTDPTI